MKLIRHFLIGAFPIISYISCVSEDFSKEMSFEKGTLDLSVEVKMPEKTRAVVTEEFPVIIYKSDGSIFKSFEKLEDVVTPLVTPVGTYYVESHTPGELRKRMDYPYYLGTDTVGVKSGVKSKVLVTCKMANTSFKQNFSTEFYSNFTNWTITINDGSSESLVFTNEDETSSDVVYWHIAPEVSKLTLDFRGITTKGTTVSQSFLITKELGSEGYVDDNMNFQGGDAIEINFDPTESAIGEIMGLTINANILFSEISDDVELKVIKKQEEEPFDPDDPDEGSIFLTLPNPITLSAEEASSEDPDLKRQGDVKITCESGIKSVKVRVDSRSDEMMEQLAAVADEYEGVDLVSGSEVVGNQNLVDFLSGLGQDISVPSENDQEYTFPIGNFFLFLGILPGQHNFLLEVTDMNGNSKNGTVTVTITE